MKSNTLTFEEKELLKEKNRKKIQLLLNYGFVIQSKDRQEQYDKANRIANNLENGETFILTAPEENILCLMVSDMALKLLKPYLKDWLKVG